MERNYNNREFEQFVKRNADQYRMIPSEKVWKGINNSLHTRRRWYSIGLASLLLLTAVSVTWVMRSYPDSKQQTQQNPAKALVATAPEQPVNPGQPVPAASSSNDILKILSLNKFDKSTSTSAPAEAVPEQNIANNFPENSTGSLPIEVNTNYDLAEITTKSSSIAVVKKQVDTETAVANNPVEPSIPVTANENNLVSKISFSPETNRSKQNTIYSPLTIESVVNSYKPQKSRKKLSWQVYVTPTVSYRTLKANKEYRNSGPFADPISYPFTTLTDVNKAVTHKPDMGLELGFSTRYPLSKNLKLRGGLQFNINRYDIKAFSSTGEQATISLSGDNNFVTAWTYYRNYNGYKTDWLKNFYLSVSVPLGLEYMLLGNSKTSLGIAGTLQPTYVLKQKAYLISTDYKNYANVPWLIRDMNLNTSFETFISFTSRNKTKWQVGPQVRYQVLSSFHTNYPVRENLFDFGLKIGVTLN
ncbi:MAG TPA: hypothetical protein VIZ28_19340 [Chitinophagaceae bacterium]